MQPKLKLSISEPCQQNWQQMTPTEQGRFCNACAKEVIDFTSLSDTEVLHYFINKKNENVCGRLYASQLNRDIIKPVYTHRKVMFYWNYFVMLFLLLFKANMGKAQVAIPKQPVENVNGKDIAKLLQGRFGCGMVNSSPLNVSGKITDTKGNPIAGATIMLKGTKTATATDLHGMYHLKDPVSNNIIISAAGYVTKEITVTNRGINDCVLQETKMGEVMVTGALIYGDDYIPVAPQKHVAVIEVRDSKTSASVKATITIENDDTDKKKQTITNKNGIYKLRSIKETENYTVTISAPGYQDSILHINGSAFNERKETKYVFLQKEEKQLTVKGETIIRMGSISSITSEPLYVIDGVAAEKEAIIKLNPDDIEHISVLKNVSVLAIYGSPASNGVILITTKKKKAIPIPKNVIAKKMADPTSDISAMQVCNIKAFPNPVIKGGSFTFSFASKAGGNYTL